MTGPHQGQPVELAGPQPADASAALVMVHGRGATARSVLDIGRQLGVDGLACLAPQAAGNEWYPNSFMAPRESNQPGLRSGLTAVGDAIERATEAGIDRDRVIVGGFSQGACLATEFAARHATRYGGVVALSGGLIGESVSRAAYGGSLGGTPVFIGCSDSDPHIPVERVHETTAVFEALDGDVDERIYPGMGHGVNRDELDAMRAMAESVVAATE